MPKPKKSKADYVRAALTIARRDGFDAISACALGRELGVSSRPLYTWYATLDELKKDVLTAARDFFIDYMQARLAASADVLYDFVGSYIVFAKEEHHLFRTLFLYRFLHETAEKIFEEESDQLFNFHWLMQRAKAQRPGCGITKENLFGLWAYVHGYACFHIADMKYVEADTFPVVIANGLRAFIPGRREGGAPGPDAAR